MPTFLTSIICNDSTFGVFLPTGNLKKLRNLLPFPYDYHFFLDFGMGDFAILVPWTEPGPKCRAKSLKGYLIDKWFDVGNLAAFWAEFPKADFFQWNLWE
jgi:hypothetical protein